MPDVSSATLAGRRAAESTYTDAFTAYSPAGKTTNADGQQVDSWTSRGTTPGKVSGPSAGTRDTDTRLVKVGGVERPVIEGGLHIPISAPLPSIGWEYVCIATGPASDPGLLNRRYHVLDVPMKSYATARRLDVVDVTP